MCMILLGIFLNKYFSDPDNRYYKHKSNAKYLFRVPKPEYLKYLGLEKIENYDWFVQVMMTSPQIRLTNHNKHIKFTEKVAHGNYY